MNPIKGRKPAEEGKTTSVVPEAAPEKRKTGSLNTLMTMFGQRTKANPDLDRAEWRPHCEVRYATRFFS
jgi:hypothetical protein